MLSYHKTETGAIELSDSHLLLELDPVRGPRNTGWVKAGSDKGVRKDFPEDRWAWRTWGAHRVKTRAG